MNKKQKRKYAERLKSEAKEYIDGIGTESERDQQIIYMIYGFVWKSFLESNAKNKNNAQKPHCEESEVKA